jgi:hypothetical protein
VEERDSIKGTGFNLISNCWLRHVRFVLLTSFIIINGRDVVRGNVSENLRSMLAASFFRSLRESGVLVHQ